MTTDTAPTVPSRFARPLAYAGGLAAVWLIAAAVRPELTYHLAPLLVAGIPPVVMALDRQDPASRRALGWAAFLGFVAAVAMAILLAVAGWLEGPAFEPFANPLVESIIGAAIGATGGLLFSLAKRP